MPRHEIVVERIPDTFRGKPVRLPPPEALHTFHPKTVAAYRALNPALRHECPSCGIAFDMSSLAPVLDAWGPEARFTVSLKCMWVPGEPSLEPEQRRERACANLKRLSAERGPPQ